jgi:branched-chain amino acid transport system permease protein
MDQPQLWVSALTQGSFFGLLGLAYYLVLIGAGFFNIAVGAYASLAGLLTSWLVVEKDFSLWPAIAIALAVTVVVAGATELFVVRPVQRRGRGSELAALVSVTALLFVIAQFAGFEFGYTTLPGQQLLDIEPVQIGGAIITANALIMIVLTFAIFLLLAMLIRTTRAGRLLRAVGDSNPVANMLGLPVHRVRLIAFLLCGLLAGVAGLLFSSQAGVSSSSGLGWAISGFLAVVIGGAGNIIGPLIGGIVLGMLQIFVPYYWGGNATNIVLLVVAAAFFSLRPQGAFAQRVRV